MTDIREDMKKVPPGTEVVRAVNLAKSFRKREVLTDISLSVRTGKTLVIMGGSGSGKTTALRILMGQDAPDRGSVHLFGTDIHRARPAELGAIRRRYGVVFQSGALLNSLSVGENVALPMRELTKLDDEVISIMVKLRLDQVGLRDFEHLRPSQLSGGMKKRVAIARALALDPEILFYDEPTAGLDPVMTAVITQLIRELSEHLGVASVVVTHDMKSAFEVADHMIMLYLGRIVAEGAPEDLQASADPLVRQFVDGDAEGPIPLRHASVGLVEDLLDD
jgi:phospholipid/cholesterol/gamma-HCH transport system ATP-binding protein